MFMTIAIQHFLRSRKKRVLAVASSSVAAQLHDCGPTAPFTLKIPIPVTSEIMCNIKTDSQLGHELFVSHFIILHETEMTFRRSLKAASPTLRDLRWSTLPIGGVSVMCNGAFCQIRPSYGYQISPR